MSTLGKQRNGTRVVTDLILDIVERGKSFFLWHTFYSTGLLRIDKTPSQTTQKTHERIVWGEPVSVLSSQASWATCWGGGGWEDSVCCGMAPIHPTAPTSSFSSSYCWYWSPVPRCWHEVSMLRMHGFATPGGSSHLILRGEVQSGHELQLLSLT